MSRSADKSGRRKQNDSIDDFSTYSEIIAADQSPRFLASETSSNAFRHKPLPKAGRKQQNRQVPLEAGSTSNSSARYSMERELPGRHHRHPQTSKQRQQKKKHPSKKNQQVPALESLFLQPKPENAPVHTEDARMHRNTEVVLANGCSPNSGRGKKSVLSKSNYHKSSGGPMRKLKLLNCFGSSGKPRDDDEEARRQRAAIQEHYSKYLSQEDNDDDDNDDNYYNEGEYGNSLASSISAITSVASVSNTDSQSAASSNQLRRSNSNNNSRKAPTVVSRSSSTAKEILDELQEEEDELESLHRQQSFSRLSVTESKPKNQQRDVDLERFEEKELSSIAPPPPPDYPEKISCDANSPPRQTQRLSPHKKQQSSQQLFQIKPPRQQLPKPSLPSSQQQKKQISETTSVIQGIVTPPRGASSTSWMMRPAHVPPKRTGGGSTSSPITYHSVAYTTGSTSQNTSRGSQTTTSVVNLASKQIADKKRLQLPKIGPRCHFCGGDHWIYNCPHMDEGPEGRRRRHSNVDYGADDEASDYLNTTTETGTTAASSVKQQSHPFQCQVCFRTW